MQAEPSPGQLDEAIRAADQRLRPYVVETPLRRARALEGPSGARVWVKCEHLQLTGSFKLRGATNKLLSLTEEQREAGIVTASSGNHGLAVAHASQRLEIRGLVFVPENVATTKAAAIEEFGVELRRFAEDCAQTEAHARQHARDHGLTYVSPYNDLDVIAGQGTVGSELLRQSPPLDTLYISVGGGGLISGVGAALAEHWPQTEIVACSPAASAVMIESLDAGRVLDLPSQPTYSDGTAGGLEPGTVTFPLCQRLVTRSIQVEEDEILEALRLIRRDQGAVLEGAAGVAAAALLRDRKAAAGRRVGVLLCGGNVSREVIAAVAPPGNDGPDALEDR